MCSDVRPAFDPPGRHASPVATALHRRSRTLVVVGSLSTLLATAVLVWTVPAVVSLSVPRGLPGVAELGPLATLRLAVGGGSLAGLSAAVLVIMHSFASDPRVRLSHGVSLLPAAVVAFCAGVAVAYSVVPSMLVLTLARGRSLVDALDPVGVVEFACFFPLVVGVGAALPVLLVAAVRVGAMPRYTSTRQRGLATLAVAAAAAAYSPPDLVTFGLFAAPLVTGLGLGLVRLERSRTPPPFVHRRPSRHPP
jgi:hypothetical protein